MIKTLGLRAAVGALSLALLSLSITAPAHAAVNEALFGKIRSAGTTVGIPADVFELAKFTLNYPEDSAIVFARAAAEDYPFFGLVGAAKAFKGRNIPGVGVFDKNACRTPIRFVNGVFDQSASKLSQGQAQTNTVTGQAKTYAASYAQAGNEQARQQAINQLNQNVPYFADIGTICNFAFETNLQAEKDIQKIVSNTARKISSAYNNFSDGDVVDGVADLISAGFSASVACDFVDSAVASSIIGKTPLLGDLAKGACKGFVGKVIDGVAGVVKDGAQIAYNAGKDVVCAVYSLFGDGCSSSPPPPTAMSEAGAYCSARGGAESLLSRTGGPNDYSVRCNDGSMCRVQPGRKACVTAAELVARRQQTIAQNEADFQTNLPKWSSDFTGRWLDKCEDENCRIGMRLVRTNATLGAQQKHTAHPEDPFVFLYSSHFWPADKQAAVLVNESIARSAELNKNITANAAPAWVILINGVWGPQCADSPCRTEIDSLARAMTQRAATLQAQQPESSSLNIQGQAGREFGPQFKKAVDNSVLRQNVNLPADQRLLAMNCTHFLGRAKEYLCSGPFPAYDICVDYAKTWQVDACMAPNRPRFVKPPLVLNLLPAQPTLVLTPLGIGGGAAPKTNTPAPAPAAAPARAGGRPPPRQ